MLGHIIQSVICASYDMPLLSIIARRAQMFMSYQNAVIVRRLAGQKLFERTSGLVQRGPFKNLRVTHNACNPAVILGVYEEELHPSLITCSRRSYNQIINIGCATGYYAVGFARMFPDTAVCAFDIQSKMLKATMEMAELNGVDRRLQVGGALTAEDLINHVHSRERLLIFMDIEGAEWSILTDAAIAACTATDIIMECHRGAEEERDRVMQALAVSHHVVVIPRAGRNPFVLPELRDLGFSERDMWMIVGEGGRSKSYGWLFATPHSAC